MVILKGFRYRQRYRTAKAVLTMAKPQLTLP